MLFEKILENGTYLVIFIKAVAELGVIPYTHLFIVKKMYKVIFDFPSKFFLKTIKN